MSDGLFGSTRARTGFGPTRPAQRALWLAGVLVCYGAGACSGESANEAKSTQPNAPGGQGGIAGASGLEGGATVGGNANELGGRGGEPQLPSGGSGGQGFEGDNAALDSGAVDTTLDSGAVDTTLDSGANGSEVATPEDYGAKGPYDVVVEKNVGEAFRNSSVTDDTFRCDAFIALVGANAPPEVKKDLTSYPDDMDRQLYTLFRPAQLEEGRRYPVLTWGNGTCSHPFLFEELLEHVASHGFIIVASNSRWAEDGTVMLHGLDFLLAENDDANSPLHGKIDPKMLGAFGHSQGSMATVSAGSDKRIVTTVPIQGAGVAEARSLNGPTFMIAGEVDDIVPASGVEDAYNAATVPAVYGLAMGQDHLMPGKDPAKIWDAVVAWFKIHLSGDQRARDLFYGDGCGLCGDSRWQIQRKNL